MEWSGLSDGSVAAQRNVGTDVGFFGETMEPPISNGPPSGANSPGDVDQSTRKQGSHRRHDPRSVRHGHYRVARNEYSTYREQSSTIPNRTRQQSPARGETD